MANFKPDMQAPAVTARMVVCPEEHSQPLQRVSIFLAGGITGCPDWQSQLMRLPLARYPWEVDFLNPRRPAFDVQNPTLYIEQIEWEHRHLERADAVLFWFCAETVQPIALFELGCYASTKKPLFVGCDPQYPRKVDVVEQLRLRRPDVGVEDHGLAALAWRVEQWLFRRRVVDNSALPVVAHDVGANLVGRHRVAGPLHVAEDSESYSWHKNTCPSCTTGQTVPILKEFSDTDGAAEVVPAYFRQPTEDELRRYMAGEPVPGGSGDDTYEDAHRKALAEHGAHLSACASCRSGFPCPIGNELASRYSS